VSLELIVPYTQQLEFMPNISRLLDVDLCQIAYDGINTPHKLGVQMILMHGRVVVWMVFMTADVNELMVTSDIFSFFQ
jgi:hypothetical protein